MKTSAVGGIALVVVLGFAGVVACSSDSSSSTPVSGGSVIKASAGGTVSDPSGTATLTIPPGALEKDTDITVKVLAASGGAVTSVFDFGPDGTTFKINARLDIKADAKLAPDGKTLAIAMGSGGTFTALEGSTFAGGVVSAPIAHFTMFTVIATGGATGTDAGTDSASDATTGGNCAFKGTFNLEKYVCGTTDVTSSWKALIPTEVMVVTDKAGGGCTMAITHTSPTCTEAESFEATLVSGTSYTFKNLGITSCMPAACTFTQGDAACMVGDRMKTETVDIVPEGAKFHVKRMSGAGDLCGGQVEDLTFAP